jgi:hypothetical protein
VVVESRFGGEAAPPILTADKKESSSSGMNKGPLCHPETQLA